MERVRAEEFHCKTHRLALQGLWGDGLWRDSGCDGSSVRCVAILWQRDEKGINLIEEGESVSLFLVQKQWFPIIFSLIGPTTIIDEL